MRLIAIIVLLASVTLFVSCSNCKVSKEQTTNQNQDLPTTTAQNLSIVTATVDEVSFKNDTDYRVTAVVISVEETERMPSMAVAGNKYVLIPNFRYDEGQLIESEGNESLKSFGKITKGKNFKAEISYEYQKGWYIQKVLSVE